MALQLVGPNRYVNASEVMLRDLLEAFLFCPVPFEALYLTVSSFQNNGLVGWPRSEMGSQSHWLKLAKCEG